MKVFVTALAEGSLAGASRVLGRSPAAVSRAVAFLEDHVGGQLLYRTTRGMKLSPAGERYAAACRRILGDLDEADLHAAGERAAPRGVLTLSGPPIAGEDVVRPIVDAFLKAYPAVSVRMLLVDRHVSLIDEGVDIALRVAELPDSSLIAIKVGADVRRVVVAAPRYLSENPRIVEPADLAKHQLVAMGNFGLDSWTFPPAPGSAASRTVSFTPRIVVNTVRAAAASAVEGLGLTRLYSYHVAEEVQDGRLIIVLADDEPRPQPVHLVVQPARTNVPKVRAFIDFATPRLKAAFTRLACEAASMRKDGRADGPP
jgi:DNA-binding transcriptional LysR family regulator